jgi:glycosyltransferase involved in cell wall biosynthesis
VKAPISLCLIVRDDPHLQRTLESARPFVEEIVVVRTTTRGALPEETRALIDVYEETDAFNADFDDEKDVIADFAAARNRSFDLATRPFVMWLDSDDVLEGGHHILELTSRVPPGDFLLDIPYKYSFDEHGNINCLLKRERLLTRGSWRWEHPIHEALAPVRPSHRGEVQGIQGICVKHERIPNHGSLARNIRILRRWLEREPEHPRALFYAGMDCTSAGMLDEGVGYLERYLKISAWEDERFFACLRVAEIAWGRGDLENATLWAWRAVECRSHWGEGWFLLCKYYCHRAVQDEKHRQRDWENCVRFGETGLALPPTESGLFVDLTLREFDVHQWLQMAYYHVGALEKGLRSAEIAYRARPSHDYSRFNIRFYKNMIARRAVGQGLEGMKLFGLDEGFIQSVREKIEALPVEEPGKGPGSQASGLGDLATTYPTPSQGLIFPPGDGPSIMIAMGDGIFELTPESIRARAMGSELAAFRLGSLLADLGWRVTIATSCGEEKLWPTDSGKSQLLCVGSQRLLESFACDVLVAWRGAHHFDLTAIEARLRVLWLHDVCAVNVSRANLGRADWIVCLSEFHAKTAREWHRDRDGIDLPSEKFVVLGNGADGLARRFGRTDVPRNPHKAVATSSPDRYLNRLLDYWPRILEQVPDAELHVFYGFDNWIKFNPTDPNLIALMTKTRLAPRVIYRGSIDEDELAREMLSAGAWLFPTHFTETYCLAALEAQAAGLRVVSTKLGALPETARAAVLIDPPLDETYAKEFIYHAVRALTMPEDPVSLNATGSAYLNRERIVRNVRSATREAYAVLWDTFLRGGLGLPTGHLEPVDLLGAGPTVDPDDVALDAASE